MGCEFRLQMGCELRLQMGCEFHRAVELVVELVVESTSQMDRDICSRGNRVEVTLPNGMVVIEWNEIQVIELRDWEQAHFPRAAARPKFQPYFHFINV